MHCPTNQGTVCLWIDVTVRLFWQLVELTLKNCPLLVTVWGRMALGTNWVARQQHVPDRPALQQMTASLCLDLPSHSLFWAEAWKHTHTQRCLVSLTISQVGTGHEGESNWKSSPLVFKIYLKKKNCNLQTELGRMWLIFWPLLSFHLLRENTFWPLRLCSHVLSLHRWRGAVGSLVHKLFSVTVKSNKKKKGDHCWRFYPRNDACLVGRAALWGRGWRTPIWLNSTFQLIFTGFI